MIYANMLTQKDLDEIEKLLDEKINERTKFLPTKDEFYAKMDELMHKLNSIEEEVTVISSYKESIEDHETRIGKIEQVLPSS